MAITLITECSFSFYNLRNALLALVQTPLFQDCSKLLTMDYQYQGEAYVELFKYIEVII